MKEVIQKVLAGYLRHALTGISTWLVAKGIASEEETTLLIVGLTGLLVTVVTQIWAKYKDRVLLVTALASPAGTTVADVKDNIAAGVKASATTPDTVVPTIKEP